MTKDALHRNYLQVAREVSQGAAALKAAMPKAMAGFGALGAAAYAEGALQSKMKELIALAIGISARCDGYHAKACFDKGATRQEVAETIAVAIQMGGSPSMVYGAAALDAFDQIASAAEVEAAYKN